MRSTDREGMLRTLALHLVENRIKNLKLYINPCRYSPTGDRTSFEEENEKSDLLLSRFFPCLTPMGLKHLQKISKAGQCVSSFMHERRLVFNTCETELFFG